MSNDNFLPKEYEVPTSGGGFTELQDGDNRFRVLSSPMMVWLIWLDGKPIRVPFDKDNKPAKGPGDKDSVKHAWGLVVWNYQTEAIEVFELDKQSVIANLYNHAEDKDWGHPKHYDIVITKKGSGMKTEYSMIAKPKTLPAQEIIDAFVANPIDLAQLLVDGGNVFLSNAGATASTEPAADTKKVVTTENWVTGDEVPDGHKVGEDGKLEKNKLPF